MTPRQIADLPAVRKASAELWARIKAENNVKTQGVKND